LIHISELADIAVAEPLRTVEPGDRVAVKILRVDADRQRIGLSRRQADELVGQDLIETEGEPSDGVESSVNEVEVEAGHTVDADNTVDEAQAEIESEE
jgi:ribosomal protein S1